MTVGNSPMRSLERAIDVLEVLDSAHGPLRLNEIAKRAGLPVATVQRILAVLEARDRVERDGYGYRPGIALTFGAHAFSTTHPLIRAARPVLIELANLTGLAATLYREHRGQRVALSRAGVSSHFGYELVVGSRLPLTTGGGKAILAELDDAALERILHAEEEPGLDPEALRTDIAMIRERGYSISREERELGVASVAAAVPVAPGSGVLAAVQVTGALDDFPEDRTADMGRRVRQAAIAIGRDLQV